MEDTYCVAFDSETETTSTGNGKDVKRRYLFSGIFDGHGGKEAALYARDHLLHNIVSHNEFWSEDDETILRAISMGFVDTHLEMQKQVGK